MAINQHGGAPTRVVDQFDAQDLGTPFKVILHKSVKVIFDDEGSVARYSIPDLDGLLRIIVISRVLCTRKLTGADIRFIRKALSIKQKDLAVKIEMTAEHLSRCEAGSLVMSPTSEKLLRIFALTTAIKLHKLASSDARTKLEDALDKLFEAIRPIAVHDVDNELVLHFHRTRPPSSATDGSCGDDDGGEWDGGGLARAA